jgi:hypothetical protein
MTTWLPASILGLIVGATVARFFYVRWKERKIAAQRRVERPNSHYDAKGVKDQRDHERWEDMDMDRLHEVNREYARELLDRVRALGVDHLRPDERDFLDRIAQI